MNLFKVSILCVGFSALFSTTAFSAIQKNKAYDLDMQLSLNGKLVSSSRVITKAGETTTIIQNSDSATEQRFIEVTAIDGSILGNKGIMMTFVVGSINKDGERKILSKPQVFAQENTKGEVTVGHGVGDKIETLSLSVVAKRKAL